MKAELLQAGETVEEVGVNAGEFVAVEGEIQQVGETVEEVGVNAGEIVAVVAVGVNAGRLLPRYCRLVRPSKRSASTLESSLLLK